jgi:hypothetical protein
MVMRTIVGLVGAAALACASTWAAPAAARDYPWCAYYGFMGEDGTNCGFDTFQQCLDTISGIGGTCRENPFLIREPRAEAPRKKRRDRRVHHD